MKIALLGVLALAACDGTFPRYSRVHSLSVLAIAADPPELGAGERATLRALAVDPAGRPITLAWAACALPPPDGQLVDPRCVTEAEGEFLTPLGEGQGVEVSMPALDPRALGLPDVTGGLYLPIRLVARAGETTVTAVYRLRYAVAGPRNRAPALGELFADGLPLRAGAVVHAGERLRLHPEVPEGEEYFGIDLEAGALAPRREQLRLSWFATDGELEADHTGADAPDASWSLVGAKEGAIDLWVVLRDDRGGADFRHFPLSCAPR